MSTSTGSGPSSISRARRRGRRRTPTRWRSRTAHARSGDAAVRHRPSNCPGARPPPGGPANACAISIHRPATVLARHHQVGVGHVTPLRDHEAEVDRRATVTTSAAAPSPHSHVVAVGRDQLHAHRDVGRREPARGEAVGERAHARGGRRDAGPASAHADAPTASTTSWPWAHVSMIRAVSAVGTLMSGPYHGTRADGSRPTSVVSTRARGLDRHHGEQRGGRQTAVLARRHAR